MFLPAYILPPNVQGEDENEKWEWNNDKEQD